MTDLSVRFRQAAEAEAAHTLDTDLGVLRATARRRQHRRHALHASLAGVALVGALTAGLSAELGRTGDALEVPYAHGGTAAQVAPDRTHPADEIVGATNGTTEVPLEQVPVLATTGTVDLVGYLDSESRQCLAAVPTERTAPERALAGAFAGCESLTPGALSYTSGAGYVPGDAAQSGAIAAGQAPAGAVTVLLTDADGEQHSVPVYAPSSERPGFWLSAHAYSLVVVSARAVDSTGRVLASLDVNDPREGLG